MIHVVCTYIRSMSYAWSNLWPLHHTSSKSEICVTYLISRFAYFGPSQSPFGAKWWISIFGDFRHLQNVITIRLLQRTACTYRETTLVVRRELATQKVSLWHSFHAAGLLVRIGRTPAFFNLITETLSLVEEACWWKEVTMVESPKYRIYWVILNVWRPDQRSQYLIELGPKWRLFDLYVSIKRYIWAYPGSFPEKRPGISENMPF